MSKFMRVQGTKLIDKTGQAVLLKGVGLGGWMLPEGYMWGTHGYFNRPRRFEELVEYYLKEDASDFWYQYYHNWISDQDFKLIKEEGYDSVRLPINFRLLMKENEVDSKVEFIEYGFRMIDYTIQECKKNDLYVILDLHGAPGGQTGQNIDDSKYDKPELFTKRIYQEQTITLWEEIAKRYKDCYTVIMYDLLNEPLPNWNKALFQYLEPLHEEIIQAIRKIDQNHIISIEGAHWATDFSTMTKKLDDNMVLHFHKYWSPPSIDTIQSFLDKREEMNLPLFMGEGGENDLYWYSSTFKMYDQLDISWNFWSYKKRNNHNSVISYNMPKDWQSIFDLEHRVDLETGRRLLYEFLEAIKFENCDVHHDVTNHLFYKDAFFTTGGLYDYLGKDISYSVSKHVESKFRPLDGVSMVNRDGEEFEGKWGSHSKEELEKEYYPFVSCEVGDYFVYGFNSSTLKEVTITIDSKDGVFDLYVNNELVGENSHMITFQPTKYKNALKVVCKKPGILKYIRFE